MGLLHRLTSSGQLARHKAGCLPPLLSRPPAPASPRPGLPPSDTWPMFSRVLTFPVALAAQVSHGWHEGWSRSHVSAWPKERNKTSPSCQPDQGNQKIKDVCVGVRSCPRPTVLHQLLPLPQCAQPPSPPPRCAQGPVSPESLASPFTPKGSITPDAPSLAYRYISRGQFSGWWGSSDSEALLALCMSSRDQGSVPPAPVDHLPLREGWQVWSLKRASGEPCGQKALASCGQLVQSNLKIPCLCVCAVSSRLSKLHPF